jgi:hypothetical protein
VLKHAAGKQKEKRQGSRQNSANQFDTRNTRDSFVLIHYLINRIIPMESNSNYSTGKASKTHSRKHFYASGTRHGSTPQICEAYSEMVRSEEKKPDPATLSIDERVHASVSLYLPSTAA